MIFLFDLNGTLFNDHAFSIKTMRTLMSEHGHELTDTDTHGILHYDGYLEDNFGIAKEEFYPGLVKLLAKASHRDLIAPGVEDCLRQIDARNDQRAVVTTFRRHGYEAYNNHFEADVKFKVAVTTDDNAGFKPDPGPLELALGRLGQYDPDLSQVWMIGDSDADIYAARNLGCHSALYRPTGAEIDQLEKDASIVFGSFDDLLQLIDEHSTATES